MSIDKILVLFSSFGAIVFVYWFFLMKKEEVVTVVDGIDIIVEGGYTPSVISIKQNKLTTINFLRKDPSGCLEEIVLPEFKVKKFLPLNQKVSINLTPLKKGEFPFSCGMNMYHGKVVVR